MEKSLILNNSYVIPIIGYGTYPLKDKLTDSIPFALKTGVRLIDTSDNYQNETFVGDGLAKGGVPDVIVVSKFSQPYRTHELEKCFRESKAKLGSLNIYLLHWPYPFLWKKQWKKMEALYMAEECDAIGVCNFELDQIKELLSFCKVKPMINQFEKHPLFQQQELVDFCHENDIAVMSYSPVARMDKSLQESRVLNEIASKYNKTVNQVILRWNVDTDCIPIPSSSSEKHIAENFDIFDFFLTGEEIDAINDLDAGKRIRYNPKTRFSLRRKIGFARYRLKLSFKK